jgi:hypothetical protein
VLDPDSLAQCSEDAAGIEDHVAAHGELTARPALGFLDLRQQFLAVPHSPGQGLL